MPAGPLASQSSCQVGAAADLGVQGYMADALAKAAACSDLGATLPGLDACDGGCLADLCRTALLTRWHDAMDVSAANDVVGTIEIDATGQIKVDDDALPVALMGNWIGSVSDGETTASASGVLTGVLSKDDSPPADPAGNPPQ